MKAEIKKESLEYKVVPFQSLTEWYFRQMEAIFAEVCYKPGKQFPNGYIYDTTDYRELCSYPYNIGHAFFAMDEAGEIVGFLFCFDSYVYNAMMPESDKYESFPVRFISRHLKHEWKFIFDLSRLGHFAFANQLAVREQYRNNFLGKKLLAEFEKFYTDKNAVMLGSVIHEGNRFMLNYLDKQDFLFVDYYVSDIDNSTIWFRVVKVINQGAFFKSINSKILPDTFNTVIPVQLNITTKNINKILKEIGAKIIWSSFFQYEYPILSRVFDMGRNYHGYYGTLIDSSEEDYPKVLKVLKEVLLYLNNKDKDASSVSLSPSLRKNGYEFFVVDDVVDLYKFESFAKTHVFDIRSLTAEDILYTEDFDVPEISTNDDIKEGAELLQWWELLLRKEEKINKRKSELLAYCNVPDFDLIESGKLDKVSKKLYADIKILERNRKAFCPPEKMARWKEWICERRFSKDEISMLVRLLRNQEKKPEEERMWKKLFYRKKITTNTKEQWGNWVALHKKLYESDKFIMKPNQLWCHAVIPMSFSGGVTGIMFTLIADKKEDTSLINYITSLISNAYAKNMFNIILKLQNSIMQRYLMKFAISSIMTRNLSHNLGSHVLAKVASINSLEKIIHLDEMLLEEERKAEIIGLSKISGFSIYMRTRMDFLADVSTSEPVSSTSRRLRADVVDKFKKEKIILENISGNNLKKISIAYQNKIKGADEDDDVFVQIPNGDIGNHALFVILENIIRNCAKHENGLDISALKLTLTVNEEKRPVKRSYKITIFDNVKRSKTAIRNTIDAINNECILKPVIVDRHKIRPNGWGIIEMKVAAAYLRKKIAADSVDDKEVSPPLLKAVAVPAEEKGKFFLGYEFYLKKPRELLIIDTDLSWTSGCSEEECKLKGIKFSNYYDLLETKVVHSHQMALLFLTMEQWQKINVIKKLPFRKIIVTDLQHKKELIHKLRSNPDDFLIDLWKYWLDEFLDRKGYAVKNQKVVFKNDMASPEEYHQITDFGKTLLFDLHGRFMDPGKDTPMNYPDYEPETFASYEAFGSSTPAGHIFLYFENLPKREKERLEVELKEAALTKVLVLDERIQHEVLQAAPPYKVKGFDYLQQLKLMHIFIPDKKTNTDNIDLNKENFTAEDKNAIFGWIENMLTMEQFDFIVIHLGLIERLTSTNPKAINDFINDRIRVHDDRPEIIITSGRGISSNLPDQVSFLHYSNIAKYIIEEKSKFHLVKTLFSARSRQAHYDF